MSISKDKIDDNNSDFKISKAPDEYLATLKSGKGYKIPVDRLKVGEMIELKNTLSNRQRLYANIYKLRVDDNKKDWKFTVRTLPNGSIAAIRLK